jgi:hypothetical protein
MEGRHSIGTREGTFFFEPGRDLPTAFKGYGFRMMCAGPIVNQSDYEVTCKSYECRQSPTEREDKAKRKH